MLKTYFNEIEVWSTRERPDTQERAICGVCGFDSGWSVIKAVGIMDDHLIIHGIVYYDTDVERTSFYYRTKRRMIR